MNNYLNTCLGVTTATPRFLTDLIDNKGTFQFKGNEDLNEKCPDILAFIFKL